MTDVPETFDWVTADKKCNVQEMFERLKKTVQGDVEIINRDKNHLFKFDDVCVMEFAVTLPHASGIGNRQRVTFYLAGLEIKVSSGGKEKFSASSELLPDSGDCAFIVQNEPLKAWQVSRKALRGLFFQ